MSERFDDLVPRTVVSHQIRYTEFEKGVVEVPSLNALYARPLGVMESLRRDMPTIVIAMPTSEQTSLMFPEDKPVLVDTYRIIKDGTTFHSRWCYVGSFWYQPTMDVGQTMPERPSLYHVFHVPPIQH